jgi:hypothetical protein
MRLAEAAAFLRTNPRTVLAYVRRGLLPPPARFGRKVRLWLLADLVAAVERLRDAGRPGGPGHVA